MSSATGKKAAPAPLLVCGALGPGVVLPVEGCSLCIPPHCIVQCTPTLQVASQNWAVWRVGCLARAGTALTLHLLALSVSIKAAWVAEPSLQFGASSFQKQRPPRASSAVVRGQEAELMPALLCRVGAAACSLLLTTVARFGLRELPCSGKMGPSVQGAWETGGWPGNWKFPLSSASVVLSLLF